MQLSYAMEMDTAHAGALADLSIKTTDSFAAEEPMCPGLPVVYGESDQSCKVLDAEGDPETVIGIVQFTHKSQDCVERFVKTIVKKTVEVTDEETGEVTEEEVESKELVAGMTACGGYYPEGWAVPVVTRGRVWVKVDGDVTGGVAKYDVENKVWSSENGVEVPCAVFKTIGSHDGYAIVEIH